MPIVHPSLKRADFRATIEVCCYSTPLAPSQWSSHHSIRRQAGDSIPELLSLITTLEVAGLKAELRPTPLWPGKGFAGPQVFVIGLWLTLVFHLVGVRSTVVAYHWRCASLSLLVKGLQSKSTCARSAKTCSESAKARLPLRIKSPKNGERNKDLMQDYGTNMGFHLFDFLNGCRVYCGLKATMQTRRQAGRRSAKVSQGQG